MSEIENSYATIDNDDDDNFYQDDIQKLQNAVSSEKEQRELQIIKIKE